MTGPRLSFTADPGAPEGISWSEAELGGAPFELARLTVDPGCVTPVDVHAVTEVWVVAQGQGELRYDGTGGIRLAPGDAVRFQPMRHHQLVNDGSEVLVVHSVFWKAPQ